MEKRAHGVLGGKIGRIKSSNVDPVWLAEKLLAAKIIGVNDLEGAKTVETPKPERLGELVKTVQGNGRRGVFQTSVKILLSEPHLEWLGEELRGKYCQEVLWTLLCFKTACGYVYFGKRLHEPNNRYLAKPSFIQMSSLVKEETGKTMCHPKTLKL